MLYKIVITCLTACIFFNGFSQNDASFKETELKITTHIEGTLTEVSKTDHLAIFIAGSGPTDRDGNQRLIKTDMFKKLAKALAYNGINSFRYDKRSVKQLKTGQLDAKISFTDFINDATDVINYFKDLSTYKSITVIGHSQGSTVGLAAQNKSSVNKFISVAGPASAIDNVIETQISNNAPQLKNEVETVLNSLRKGNTTPNYPTALQSLFNLDAQEFLISWMAYKPTEEIQKLNIPTLVIQGTNDLQVSTDEGKKLAAANKNAELILIENMNHVLVTIETNDLLSNTTSYNDPQKELSTKLTEVLVNFINKEEHFE